VVGGGEFLEEGLAFLVGLGDEGVELDLEVADAGDEACGDEGSEEFVFGAFDVDFEEVDVAAGGEAGEGV